MLYSIKDICAKYKLSRTTIHRWIQKGKIKSIRQGHFRLIYENEVKECIGKVQKKEIEKILGVTESTVYRWINSGKLKVKKINGAWVYDKQDAIKLAKENEKKERNRLSPEEYRRKYYLTNKERVLKKSKECSKRYYKEHPEKSLERGRKYRKNHRETIDAYLERNKERISTYKHEWHLKHRDEVLERCNKWWASRTPAQLKKIRKDGRRRYKEHPEKVRQAAQVREVRIRAGGSFTKEDWLEILEKYDYRCIYCGSKDKITVEHIYPICRGGTNQKDNIAPACWECNLKKNRMTKEEFLEKRRPYLLSKGYQEVMEL